jgi:uncharacterized membrane protein (DUF373 family)
MIEIVNRIEKVIYAVLIVMLVAVLIAAIADLAWILVTSLIVTTPWLLQTHEMISVLGGFLLVLIGVELLETIKAYFHENAIHVEIVVLLAIIAVARKVILLDPGEMSGSEYGFQLIGTGILIAGLAAGYYMIKKAGITIGSIHDDNRQK